MNAIIERCRLAGIRLRVEGTDLQCDAPRGAMTPELITDLKAHKPAILAALAHPDPFPLPRGLGGYAAPPGVPPLGDCALARQLLAMPEDDPVPGHEASAMPHVSLDATPPNLSAKDLEDIAAGDIPLGTVQVFEAVANDREAADLRKHFEERSTILEDDAGLPKAEAQLEAARITGTLARNRGYLWASLREAVSRYPALLAQVPDRPGTVDSLPFGTATVHVPEGAKPGPVSGSIVITEAEIEAARKGRTVVRQGTFTGAQEVKV